MDFSFYQWDFDATPIAKRKHFNPTEDVKFHNACGLFGDFAQYLRSPDLNLHEGLIATGDKFLSNGFDELKNHVNENLYSCTEAIDMECSALEQVCRRYGVPFGVVKYISDNGDASDFEKETADGSFVLTDFLRDLLEDW